MEYEYASRNKFAHSFSFNRVFFFLAFFDRFKVFGNGNNGEKAIFEIILNQKRRLNVEHEYRFDVEKCKSFPKRLCGYTFARTDDVSHITHRRLAQDQTTVRRRLVTAHTGIQRASIQ